MSCSLPWSINGVVLGPGMEVAPQISKRPRRITETCYKGNFYDTGSGML
jgi:hypothetical protein